jgi:DNA-binding transcriptional LysR family regulator
MGDHMTSEELLTFITIGRTGGFSKAADLLGRSQPAISRRIALLEEELGVPLFERVAGGAVLSAAGEALLPHARKVLAALEDCRAAIDDLRSGGGALTIALVGTLAGANLTPQLSRFAREYPQARVSLRTANSSQVSELVREGSATVGLRYHRDDHPELDCVEIAAEPLQIVCATDHNFAGVTVRSLRELGGARWLLFPNADRLPNTAADNLLARFRTLGVAELDWMPVDSLTAQKRLVEAGFGLAVLPRSACADELRAGTLALVVLADIDLANPVCLVTRRSGYLSPGAQALIAQLRAPPAA